MSGPIVRTGTTPEFWKNWDKAFGAEKPKAAAKGKKATPKKKPAKAKSKAKK